MGRGLATEDRFQFLMKSIPDWWMCAQQIPGERECCRGGFMACKHHRHELILDFVRRDPPTVFDVASSLQSRQEIVRIAGRLLRLRLMTRM